MELKRAFEKLMRGCVVALWRCGASSDLEINVLPRCVGFVWPPLRLNRGVCLGLVSLEASTRAGIKFNVILQSSVIVLPGLHQLRIGRRCAVRRSTTKDETFQACQRHYHHRPSLYEKHPLRDQVLSSILKPLTYCRAHRARQTAAQSMARSRRTPPWL